MKRRTTDDPRYNPKRRLAPAPATDAARGRLRALAAGARYDGNPEHKRNPGDFGLTPPASPRRGKALCDDAGVFRRGVALGLVRAGIEKGLVDGRGTDGGWPGVVWAVTEAGEPVEAQHGANGVYHGYWMPADDPLRDEVLLRWRGAEP